MQSNTAIGARKVSGALLRLMARYVKFLVPIPGRGVLYAPRNAYTSSRVLYLLRRSRQAPFWCKHAKQYLKINTAYFGIAGGWTSLLLQLKTPLYSYPFRYEGVYQQCVRLTTLQIPTYARSLRVSTYFIYFLMRILNRLC